MENFIRMLGDARLLNSLRVTFTYVIVSVPLQLIFARVVAMVLDRGMRGLAFYRSVFYLPSLLGSSVAIAILWRQIFGTSGLINQVLAVVGIEGPGWISNPTGRRSRSARVSRRTRMIATMTDATPMAGPAAAVRPVFALKPEKSHSACSSIAKT